MGVGVASTLPPYFTLSSPYFELEKKEREHSKNEGGRGVLSGENGSLAYFSFPLRKRQLITVAGAVQYFFLPPRFFFTARGGGGHA